MKIEELKIGQTVFVKGIITDIEKDEILDLEIHTSENNFCVNSSDVYVRIDKPKPEVPKFVADWIEICDMRFVNLNYIFGENCPEKVKEWASVYGNHKKMLQALLYGYTVEKEKVYQIIDKRLNATFSCLGYDIDGRAWFWGNKKFFLKNKGDRLAHTRQQLIDAGFEEVFKNPNYEAKEVTE